MDIVNISNYVTLKINSFNLQKVVVLNDLSMTNFSNINIIKHILHILNLTQKNNYEDKEIKISI